MKMVKPRYAVPLSSTSNILRSGQTYLSRRTLRRGSLIVPMTTSEEPQGQSPPLCPRRTSLHSASSSSSSCSSRTSTASERRSACLLAPTTTDLTFRPSTPNPQPPHPLRAAADLGDKSRLQYSIHKPGRGLLKEIALVFPSIPDMKDVVVVPTFQQTATDLVHVNGDTGYERDLLLRYIEQWATQVSQKLSKLGYWSDLADPSSGYPLFSQRGPHLYPDVDGSSTLLRYQTIQVGCCRVLVHPTWGTRAYPATFFACAPWEAVRDAIESVGSQPIEVPNVP
ncbi:hypothetical protein DFS34DRAFT_606894 [Phlyctochytrium arcticum]|nr:hypothetical protein DFS34DRAFT_606894 [Phlyctochytrium arcticum]